MKIFNLISINLISKKDSELIIVTCMNIKRFLNENNIKKDILKITDVNAKKKMNKIIVTITLGRPGLLIGKGGKTIDDLNGYLADRFKKEVKIKIIESKYIDYL